MIVTSKCSRPKIKKSKAPLQTLCSQNFCEYHCFFASVLNACLLLVGNCNLAAAIYNLPQLISARDLNLLIAPCIDPVEFAACGKLARSTSIQVMISGTISVVCALLLLAETLFMAAKVSPYAAFVFVSTAALGKCAVYSLFLVLHYHR